MDQNRTRYLNNVICGGGWRTVQNKIRKSDGRILLFGNAVVEVVAVERGAGVEQEKLLSDYYSGLAPAQQSFPKDIIIFLFRFFLSFFFVLLYHCSNRPSLLSNPFSLCLTFHLFQVSSVVVKTRSGKLNSYVSFSEARRLPLVCPK